MNYRGEHRKYEPGTSVYRVYKYGDIVTRSGVSYICNVETSYGYLPSEEQSGFIVLGGGGATGGISFSFGTSAPSSPVAGQQWFDSSTGLLYVYVVDEDSGQWIQPNAGPTVIDGGTI
jgi:hypothetical protein